MGLLALKPTNQAKRSRVGANIWLTRNRSWDTKVVSWTDKRENSENEIPLMRVFEHFWNIHNTLYSFILVGICMGLYSIAIVQRFHWQLKVSHSLSITHFSGSVRKLIFLLPARARFRAEAKQKCRLNVYTNHKHKGLRNIQRNHLSYSNNRETRSRVQDAKATLFSIRQTIDWIILQYDDIRTDDRQQIIRVNCVSTVFKEEEGAIRVRHYCEILKRNRNPLNI